MLSNLQLISMSTFACAGKEHKGKYILLGLTSGGRSRTGGCGGVNTITVYARIKKLMKWIKKHVNKEYILKGEKELCFESKSNNK